MNSYEKKQTTNKKQTNHLFYQSSLFFSPLLPLDSDGKFLLPFLCAIVNLCCKCKEIIGYLIYELRRSFPEELQPEIWNPTVRKVYMEHLTKLDMYFLLGLRAAAVTMKRISKFALLLRVVSIPPWPAVNSRSRTLIWLSVLCKLLSHFFFFLFSLWQLKNFNYTASHFLYRFWGNYFFLLCFLSCGLLQWKRLNGCLPCEYAQCWVS